MAKTVKLEAELREKAGKGVARALRREEKTPAVIYGGKDAPVSITLSTHDLTMEYHKGKMFTTLYDIKADGKETMVLPRDIQLHPVTDNVMHVDFLRVTEKTKLVVSVPVNLINAERSPGMEDKGILNTVRFEVDLLVSATKIPDQIDVDMTGKEHGDAIKLSDAIMPEGAQNASDRDVTIAVINAPKRAASTEEAEGETAEGETAEGEEAASEE
jgi:large subunit ribosomal protein L25